MGAQDFTQYARGATATEAFNKARDDALHEHGHGGYTGSIAEKQSFKMIHVPAEFANRPGDYIDKMLEEDHPSIRDKWGPAGCIMVGPNEYCFFGIASS